MQSGVFLCLFSPKFKRIIGLVVLVFVLIGLACSGGVMTADESVLGSQFGPLVWAGQWQSLCFALHPDLLAAFGTDTAVCDTAVIQNALASFAGLIADLNARFGLGLDGLDYNTPALPASPFYAHGVNADGYTEFFFDDEGGESRGGYCVRFETVDGEDRTAVRDFRPGCCYDEAFSSCSDSDCERCAGITPTPTPLPTPTDTPEPTETPVPTETPTPSARREAVRWI